jgi:hypothetical protein
MSKLDDIKRINDLLKDGFLSQEEYDKLKQQIIGGQNDAVQESNKVAPQASKEAGSTAYSWRLFSLVGIVVLITISILLFTHYKSSVSADALVTQKISIDTIVNQQSPTPSTKPSNNIQTYNEASNTLDDFRNNENNKSTVPATVGEPYQGGIVAHIYQAGEQGYIDGETHGFIMASRELFGTWNNAQKICDTLNINGVTHWQLPTLNELTMIYRNIHQLGGYESGSHGVWCSYQVNQTSASVCSFDGHGAFVSLPKSSVFFIRPIKYF